MKEITVKILKFDLPAYTLDFQCVIQIGKVGDLPLSSPELINIKGTDLNEFLDNPAEEFIKEGIRKRFDPLLEHKDQVVGEIIFKKAKLTAIRGK